MRKWAQTPMCCTRATDQESSNRVQAQVSHIPKVTAWTMERQVLLYHRQTYGGNIISKDLEIRGPQLLLISFLVCLEN